MRMRLFVVAVTILLLAFGASAQDPARSTCDRACLENYLDQYLDAMMADDPNLELFAKSCRFTENGVRLPLGGEGLWYSMSARGTYKFYIPDVETRQIAFIGTVREGGGLPRAKAEESAPGATPSEGTLAAVAIRLKIDDYGKISEAEQLVIRPETSLFAEENVEEKTPPRFPPTGEAVEKMGAPHEIFLEVIPEEERMSREELVKIGNYYFEGLQRNDTKGYYPFTENCVRFENGMPTTFIYLPAFDHLLRNKFNAPGHTVQGIGKFLGP